MNALYSFESLDGFYIVVNIDNKESPIELEELKEILLNVENK
jgi:hypothetical protein